MDKKRHREENDRGDNVLANALTLIKYDECDRCGEDTLCTVLKDDSHYGVDLLMCIDCIKKSFKKKQKAMSSED